MQFQTHITVDDGSVYFDTQMTTRATRSITNQTLDAYAENVVENYKRFVRDYKVRGRQYDGLIVNRGQPNPILLWPISTRAVDVIYRGYQHMNINMREFGGIIRHWMTTSFPSQTILQFHIQLNDDEAQQLMNASVQQGINNRFAISNVNHALPPVGPAQPGPSLTSTSVYTQNTVDPQSAVYINKNLADGKVTSLYDWNDIRATLGQNPILSPATRAAFQYQNVHRMHPNTVQQIINRSA